MENKVFRPHRRGQKHIGNTDWNKVRTKEPEIDEENPELAYKKRFSKSAKS